MLMFLSDLWVRLTFGQMYPPSKDILWPSVLLLWSGWPLVRCMSDRDILWPSLLLLRSGWPLVRQPPGWGFGSGWHLLRPQVRLAFGQKYSKAETFCGHVCYYFGQADLWSDVPPGWGFGSGWHLVRLGLADLWWDVPPRQRHLVDKCVATLVRLTSGQMYSPGWSFGSSWHLVRLWVRLIFGKMYPQPPMPP